MSEPRAVTSEENLARRKRVARIARDFGFTGRVEYRHIYGRTGGAQYGQGTTVPDDVLSIFAEAFERDADPDDFSLEAIIAHERGHQMLVRHPRIARRVKGRISGGSEEVLASLLGAMICPVELDRDTLVAKATFELVDHGVSLDEATRRLQELWNLLETLL